MENLIKNAFQCFVLKAVGNKSYLVKQLNNCVTRQMLMDKNTPLRTFIKGNTQIYYSGNLNNKSFQFIKCLLLHANVLRNAATFF